MLSNWHYHNNILHFFHVAVKVEPRLSHHFIVYTIFVSNFIGVVFARTLHYQFYSWYFHTIPYLSVMAFKDLWSGVNSHMLVTCLLGICVVAASVGIEVAFNVYPATSWSSILLQVLQWWTITKWSYYSEGVDIWSTNVYLIYIFNVHCSIV
jgi:ALG3 protein